MVTGRPMASAAEYPKVRSAAPFQLLIIPCRSLETMASSEDSTMAARLARACSACVDSVTSMLMPINFSGWPCSSK